MISIIVPTLNEAESLAILVERVAKAIRNEKYELVVVDDNSTDGTYEKAVSLKIKYPIRVFSRKTETGMGSAIIRGFIEAKGDILGVIDGDLQHPPEKIPELIAEIRKGADIAVGSRLVKGGGVRLWPWHRRAMSLGSWIIAIPLSNVRDAGSGFFFMKKGVIKGTELNPIGCKTLLEILVKGRYKTVKEVPYTFIGRSLGQSKFDSRVVMQYLIHVARLYRCKFLGTRG